MSETVEDSLEYLKHLLSNLPDTVPSAGNIYDFRNFVPDPELVELFGSREAALNNALEVVFAPRGRLAGPNPFILIDQGPGLVAVVDVLRNIINEYPQSAILQKWVDDLKNAAVYQFNSSFKSVCCISCHCDSSFDKIYFDRFRPCCQHQPRNQPSQNQLVPVPTGPAKLRPERRGRNEP